MKTKEELNALKEEVEALNQKLAELSEEELKQISGGYAHTYTMTCPKCGKPMTVAIMTSGTSEVHIGQCACGYKYEFSKEISLEEWAKRHGISTVH